jgi:starvation-inducible DNA-binding protein
MPHNNFYGRKNVKVTTQPNIGLDADVRKSVVEMLNLLLADEAVLALKTQRSGRHADGTALTELQSLYHTQYQQIRAITNEVKERVQILGGSARISAEESIESARLGSEQNNDSSVVSLLADHEAFIRFLRDDTQQCSEMYEDQGTFALLVQILRMHEKMAWMIRSTISAEQFDFEK